MFIELPIKETYTNGGVQTGNVIINTDFVISVEEASTSKEERSVVRINDGTHKTFIVGMSYKDLKSILQAINLYNKK